MNTAHFESIVELENGLKFLVFLLPHHACMKLWPRGTVPRGEEGRGYDYERSRYLNHLSSLFRRQASPLQSVIACKNIRATVIVPLWSLNV